MSASPEPAASASEDLEAAADQAIQACGGDAREAVKALLVAVDFLEAQVRRAPDGGLHRLRARPVRRAARPQGRRAETAMVKAMPISIDLEKNPLLRGMVEHVRRDCTVDNIVVVLRARFGSTLPRETSDRLRDCQQDELDELLGRSAVAPTLGEALRVRLAGAEEVGPTRTRSKRRDE